MGTVRQAKYSVGQVVRHRFYPFRGVVFDIDPVFDNTEEWWLAIPEEIRPSKDQPFYHLLAENADSEYIAYVSEQNLLADDSGEPLRHPQIKDYFEAREGESYVWAASYGFSQEAVEFMQIVLAAGETIGRHPDTTAHQPAINAMLGDYFRYQ